MKLTLDGGHVAALTAVDVLKVQLRSPVAAAPGTPLKGKLQDGRSIRVKVHRCVRDGDHFDIAGKLIDATRELREKLNAAFASAP
jgi:hypothetical protein